MPGNCSLVSRLYVKTGNEARKWLLPGNKLWGQSLFFPNVLIYACMCTSEDKTRITPSILVSSPDVRMTGLYQFLEFVCTSEIAVCIVRMQVYKFLAARPPMRE